MTAELVAAIRKNRQVKVTIGKFVFTCRRPTSADVHGDGFVRMTDFEMARDYVIDWGDNVTEDDIRGGGGTDVQKFDPIVWREWCADRDDFWTPIAKRCIEAWKEYDDKLKAAAKN